jgi:hypothetical protein
MEWLELLWKLSDTLELIEGMLVCRLLLEILVMHQGQLEEMVTFQEILF